MKHIFLNTHDLSLSERSSILKDAYVVKTKAHVDKLDCSVSYSRIMIDMSFDEVMEKFNMSSHFVIIHRKDSIDGEYGEIGFRTMQGNIDHFLWIYVTLEYLYGEISKYNLDVMR